MNPVDTNPLQQPSSNWCQMPTGCDIMTNDDLTRRGQRHYNWEQLLATEARRRKILRCAELPFWRILSLWDGTCLRALAQDYLVWLTIGLYAFIRIQARYYAFPRLIQELGNTDIGVIGGFLSFFLVLFVNQSNRRFQQMYMKSMGCSGKISDVASLVVLSFPRHNAHRLVRYLNAAHAAAYVGLNDVYTKRDFFDNLNRIQSLLHPYEMERIEMLGMDFGADAAHELIMWALMDVQQAYKADQIDARESATLKEKILQFRDDMDSLYDMCDQPIHFFYIHFLCLLSLMYLPLFAIDNAYSAGTGDDVHWVLDVVMGMIVALQAIFVVGLRVLGQKMIDPYGDDLEDLSVIHYVREAWKSSNRILSTQFPGNVQTPIEEKMDLEEESVGPAWEAPARNSAIL
jgi:predicted membrane chloride channel (bestrophin family)